MENLPDDMFYEILSYFSTKKEISLLCNVSKRFQKNTLKLHFNWSLFNKDAKTHENNGLELLKDNDLKNLNPTPFSLQTSKYSRGRLLNSIATYELSYLIF